MGSSGGWYNENYISRQAVTVDFSAVTAVPSAYFVEIEIPADWDQFWDNIRSDGNDIVITDSAGTKLDFQFKSGFNLSTRTLTLEVEQIDVPVSKCMLQLFLYYNNPDQASSEQTSISPSSPKFGHVFLGAATSKIVEAQNLFPVGTAPITTYQKQTTEIIDIYFSTQGILGSRVDAYNEKPRFEEIHYVTVKSLNSSGTDSDTRYQLDETRFINGYVRARSKAGDDGSNYAFGVQIKTTVDQIYDIRTLLKIKDLLPN